MEPGSEKVRVRAANVDFVGEEMVSTTAKPAVDEKAEDTSVEEGRDDERAAAERSDSAKEMMSATASSLTPNSKPQRLR